MSETGSHDARDFTPREREVIELIIQLALTRRSQGSWASPTTRHEPT